VEVKNFDIPKSAIFKLLFLIRIFLNKIREVSYNQNIFQRKLFTVVSSLGDALSWSEDILMLKLTV
jgi:hypothetical protein